MDSDSNIYVSDKNNDVVRKITNKGQVSTLAGSSGFPGSADGLAVSATFNGPAGLIVNAAGEIYLADSYNSQNRKIAEK